MEWDWGDIYLIFIYIYFPTATLNHWSDGPMATPWPHGFAGDALCAREGKPKPLNSRPFEDVPTKIVSFKSYVM